MAVSNSLTRTKNVGLTAYLTQDAVKNQISKVLGGDKGQEFIASIISAVNTNPQLQECANSSIVSGALLGASLNLTPSPQLGQFYLVPFNDKDRGMLAQFILGYHGILQLAIRSGQYKKINVLPIKQGELIRFDPLEEEIEVNLIEDEEQRENAPTIGYYATFSYINGFKKSIYWSKKKMESHAKRYSRAYAKGSGASFWLKDFDAMACKTMLRQLITKWGAMDTTLQKAVSADTAVISEDMSPVYVENEMETQADFMPLPEAPKPEQMKPEEKKQDQSSVASALFG